MEVVDRSSGLDRTTFWEGKRAQLNIARCFLLTVGLLVLVSASGVLEISPAGPTRAEATSPGEISTFAGNGTAGFADGPVASAQFSFPWGIAVDSTGNIYVADNGNFRIRKISGGTVTTVAGTGSSAANGDGGPATSAAIGAPTDLAFDGAGNLYFGDELNCVVRKVNTSQIISTVAGSGCSFDEYAGDGGAAVDAILDYPVGIAAGDGGEIYIADGGAYRVFKVGTNGIINTVAGDGTDSGFKGSNSGDGGPATSAQLRPFDVELDGQGGFFIADEEACRVRYVGADGILSTFAGIGDQTAVQCGAAGDGGPAVSGELSQLERIGLDSNGVLYVGEPFGCRVRRIRNGVLATVAGNGTCSFSGDGGAATNATVDYPTAVVAVGADLYFADSGNNRIRKISEVDSVTDPAPPALTPAQPRNVSGPPSENPSIPMSNEPINLATGNYTYQRTDVFIPTKGLPLVFARSYNSQDSFNGALGAGWRSNVSAQLTFDNTDHSIANVTVMNEGGGKTTTHDGLTAVTPSLSESPSSSPGMRATAVSI